MTRPRVAIADYGGPVPAVVQMRDSETAQDALDRLDAECAAVARADGLGALVCADCDRPNWICRLDPATHARRAAKRARALPSGKSVRTEGER